MHVIRNLILLGARSESEVNSICKAANIDRIDLDDIEMKVSLETNIAVMDALLQITGDKDIGLHLGEKATPPIIGQAGHLQQSSSDLLTAFKNTAQYTRTFTALFDYSVVEKSDQIWLYYEPVQVWNDIDPENARQGIDVPFAATLNFMKTLSGQKVFPIKVLYRYAKIEDTSEHERIFKCKPLFNQSCNCIVFNKSDLEIPILSYNPQLNTVIKKLLQERLRKSQAGSRFSSTIRETISNNFEYDFPSLETISLGLNITPRTLQRKLQKERTNYRAISDSIKLELASTLLKYNELTISEIAYKLGYAEPAAFRKAFKQWTKRTPIEYRNSNRKLQND